MIGVGLVLGLALPLIVSTVCMTFFDKPNARYIIYGVCGFSFFTFILLAFVCILAGLIIPTVRVHSESIQDEANLNDNLNCKIHLT